MVGFFTHLLLIQKSAKNSTYLATCVYSNKPPNCYQSAYYKQFMKTIPSATRPAHVRHASGTRPARDRHVSTLRRHVAQVLERNKVRVFYAFFVVFRSQFINYYGEKSYNNSIMQTPVSVHYYVFLDVMQNLQGLLHGNLRTGRHFLSLDNIDIKLLQYSFILFYIAFNNLVIQSSL